MKRSIARDDSLDDRQRRCARDPIWMAYPVRRCARRRCVVRGIPCVDARDVDASFGVGCDDSLDDDASPGCDDSRRRCVFRAAAVDASRGARQFPISLLSKQQGIDINVPYTFRRENIGYKNTMEWIDKIFMIIARGGIITGAGDRSDPGAQMMHAQACIVAHPT